MALAASVTVRGMDEFLKRIDRVNPERAGREWVQRALVKAALLTQQIATTQKIKRGGKGPPLPGILTSRTGTLRRSIRVNRQPLPKAIEVGSDLIYAGVHELGGRFHPPRPFLSPALDDASKQFDRIFAKELERALA